MATFLPIVSSEALQFLLREQVYDLLYQPIGISNLVELLSSGHWRERYNLSSTIRNGDWSTNRGIILAQ
jgi:hypothetical protein